MGDLGVSYTVHLWLVGKRVVDFLLALVELFCLLSCVRRYARILVEIVVIIIIIIIITRMIFMVLSSWQSHCESSPGSFD